MDGTEFIGEKNIRQTLEPGQDVSTFPQKIRSICALVWTPAVIAAYQLKKADPPA